MTPIFASSLAIVFAGYFIRILCFCALVALILRFTVGITKTNLE